MPDRTLFDNLDFDPCDPSVPSEERPRLSRQCREILERLQNGPATNLELAAIALKYTGRVSDLRKSGWDVRLWRQDHKTGVTVYGLGQKPDNF